MIEFRLPAMGSDMDQGTLLEWRVQPGDRVVRGQVLAVVDTAKAAIEVECWHEGIVHALLAKPGVTLPVGSLMAVLRAEGEDADEVTRSLAQRTGPEAGPIAPVPMPVAPVPQAVPAAAAAATPGERPRISPAARRRARELGIDPVRLAGHAGGGAVSLHDVEAAAQSAARPPASAVAVATAAGGARAHAMRQVIAAAMSRSKREIPHYYLAEDIAFERAAAWLAERNQGLPVSERLLSAAVLLKAVALALRRCPEFNGTWRDGGFVPGAGVHLGVAVAMREGGLVAPALHDVPTLDLATLTRALLDLVKRTRAGALRSSELADATITVTNLGDQGVGSVLGVIYPPQVALVGFGRVAQRPWVTGDGGLRAAPVVTATLAADHRASDGHRGALLLAEIRELLQEPDALDAREETR